MQNRFAIATPSLGQHSTHTLPQKITSASQAGIQGLEITYPDLEGYAKSQSTPMLEAAPTIRKLCAEANITILSFCAFENFEGHYTPISERLQKAKEWLAIAHTLGAEHLQVPSNYDRKASGDRKVIISEFRQLSDLAAAYTPVIKIAYENLAWGTHCDLWQQALQLAQDVERDNFGLCLDSFHFTARLWGDPFVKGGIQPQGPQQLRESLHAMKKLPLDKLFYLQLSDGELLDPPYSENHPWFDDTLEPGHVWSNEARPFPGETDLGAYMPVWDVVRAFVVDLGYTGWISLETFDRRMREEAQGPVKNAKRATDSWKMMEDEMARSSPRLGKL